MIQQFISTLLTLTFNRQVVFFIKFIKTKNLKLYTKNKNKEKQKKIHNEKKKPAP